MFNVYGPTQNLANMKQGMVSIYLAYLMQGPYVLVKGSLDRFRDFVYIDDVVDGWLAALDNPKSHGQVFNLASGRKTLVRELLPELIRALGHDPDTCTIEQGEGTPGDQFGVYADITAIKSSLGWQPKVSLAEGIDKLAAWAGELVPPATH
jgi:UDP-glucose 4-epimerase